MSHVLFTRATFVLLVLAITTPSWGEDDSSSLKNLAQDKLVAWCIVPFDAKKRSPAERAEMLQRLGLKRVAYDWRAEHVPTFEQETLEYKKHNIEYFAFWGTHPEALRLFKKYDLHPQIWQTLGSPAAKSQDERVASAAQALLPLVETTRKMKSKLGLYNHGGWGGEPANMIAVCEYLREHHAADHVGIVYNQHHAHNHIDDFAAVIRKMKPYLLCVNLNGMTRNGDAIGKKILPLGEGEFDVQLLKSIRDSGYLGPIGIIGHTQDDVELRLRDNLDGLNWLLPQLQGKPAGTKPKLRTWTAARAQGSEGKSKSGVVLPGNAKYRQPPITIEVRATLTQRANYNILVASDTKASGAHWELFSMNGSGHFTAYLPGMQPDHVRSTTMICDGRPHTMAMQYEGQRVRLFVDGKVVADEAVKSTNKPIVAGGLGIGRLVSGRIGSTGTIDWVRVSTGIREIKGVVSQIPQRDADTLLIWSSLDQAAPKTTSMSNTRQRREHLPELVRSLLQQASERGDATRGLALFADAKSACLSCHRIGDYGGRVGPDLAQSLKKRKPAEIIEGVLWPKRHVVKEFAARLILTDDGRSHRGYVVSRTKDEVVLRDPTKPTAPPTRIKAANIEDEQDVGTLMPDNLTAAMSTQQELDLFRFLLTINSNDGVAASERDMILMHAHAHSHGPATFAYERKPLDPKTWPHWEHHVNRDRVYDFYRKEARHFRDHDTGATLLVDFPGLDGGEQGHWGNQNDDVWASDLWNETKLDVVQAGIFRDGKTTVPRGVCVQLGDVGEISTCFNPDTLTFDAAWKGGFLKFSNFRHGFLDGVKPIGKPVPMGDEVICKQPYTYKGYYRIGRRVIFASEIGGVDYFHRASIVDGKLQAEMLSAKDGVIQKELENIPASPPQTFERPITLGSGSPYAVDTFTLPTDNPWKMRMFVGGVAFTKKGDALACTMQGDVWRVTDFAYPSTTAKWSRFASGLHHALGIVCDDDGIFVLGRDQITRLHDLNDDGTADFYECFSNAYVTSPAGHDFICGLERDSAGSFYLASGNQGIVRISPDGKEANVIATGFRNPDGLGLLPDGTVTVPCSEGSWTPASMICAARPSWRPSFHGMGGPRENETLRLPLVYLPRGVDNSAGGQTLVNSDKWGPLAGQLLHFSFGTGRHMLILRDEVDGQLQGAAVPLPGELQSGAHRGRFNPHDGQLYVGGMQGWGSYTPNDGSFDRVRYTGDSVQLPTGFRAHENGVAIDFSSKIDSGFADATKQFAQCWNYRYSAAYGSLEYSTKHFGMRGHDRLAIKSAHVVNDGRTLFLEIPELQPVNQLHLVVTTSATHEHELFATVHKLAEPFTDYPGYHPTPKTITPHPILADLALAQKSVPNPFAKKIKGARKIELETGTNLSYKTRMIRVQAGEKIELTLSNPDVVPHNWALVKPGALQRVGALANKLISDPEAAIRHYVPDSSDVLAHTDVVLPKDKFTIYFRAPKTPGRYPYLCTFPGHWLIMNGELVVE